MHLPEANLIAHEAVPGSGHPRLTLLGSGLNNDTYRVERDGRAFSMRIAVTMSPALARDRTFELAVLGQAGRHLLAPPLVNGDAERGFLVQEWALGRAWTANDSREAAAITLVADLLRRVHRLKQPSVARTMSARDWVQYYDAALQGAGVGSTAFKDAAQTRLEELEALPRQAGVVCHSDLHLLNLIERPVGADGARSLMLLDWEYSHVSDAFWDLAGWSANNDFSEALQRALLGAYLGHEPQDREWIRCRLLFWLYDYVCLLWSELYLRSRRGSAAAGIATRAELLEERLRGA